MERHCDIRPWVAFIGGHTLYLWGHEHWHDIVGILSVNSCMIGNHMHVEHSHM